MQNEIIQNQEAKHWPPVRDSTQLIAKAIAQNRSFLSFATARNVSIVFYYKNVKKFRFFSS